MILVKSMLLGLPVYWFEIAHIPRSIMNYLRCCMFTFLWGSSGGKHKMHLVNWLTISKPHDYGGWNNINLDWLCTSLKMKRLWMVLNGNGT